jgi:hypothetical protein
VKSARARGFLKMNMASRGVCVSMKRKKLMASGRVTPLGIGPKSADAYADE